MGFVERVYGQIIAFLDDVAKTQFGAVADAVGTTGQLMATIAAILILITFSMGRGRDGASETISTIIRLVLVATFFQNWKQFDGLASGIFSLFETVGGALVKSVSSETSGETVRGYSSFAREFDGLVNDLTEIANQVSKQMGIVGGSVFYVFFAGLMAVISGIAVIVLSASRIIISLLIGIAPVMILATLFSFGKPYFEKWVSAMVTFALYPVVIAGVFATVIGITKSVMEDLPATDITNIGGAIPIMMVGFLSLGLFVAIPFIVGAISGQFHLRDPISGMAGRAVGRGASMGAAAAGGAALGAARGAPNVARETASAAKAFTADPAQASRDAMAVHQANMRQLWNRFNK